MKFTNYNQEHKSSITVFNDSKVSSFISEKESNLDEDTVDSFGEEWLKFNAFTDKEIDIAGSQYFDIVDELVLNKEAVVLDLGCGSGRWTKYIAKKVKLTNDEFLALAKSIASKL